MGVMAIFVALSHSIASLFLPTPPRAEGGDTRDLVDWKLRQEGRNTIIEVFGQDVAILEGVRADRLTESNFLF
jgi:hypothetical protein